MKGLEKILIVFILILLVLPAIQKEFSFFTIKELDGDFELTEKPDFNWEDWFEGKFQTRI